MTPVPREYRNPIATDGDYADPFVLRFNGRYYLYCTSPQVQCWSSEDLTHWTLEGPTISEDEFPGLVPFAPEVFYADGAFSMVTSPHGRGHYILRSASPLGPFTRIVGNVGRAIDGNVLIDDDGRWYFYWAGWEGIWGCEMPSPTEFGDPVLTGAQMNGWTEGPFVAKHDGRYYMTLTGNHFLSSGYRVNVAVSDHPLRGFVDDARNPVLVCTDGPAVGLGHSSSALGPDLVSTYLVYHSIRADQRRDLNLDRQVWSGRSLQVLGPSLRSESPARPDAESRWPAAAARWSTSDSPIEAGPEWGTLRSGSARWAEAIGEGPFTLEVWFAPEEGASLEIGFSPSGEGYEPVFALEPGSGFVTFFEHEIETPPAFVPDAPHLLRVVADDDGVVAYLDGRFQFASAPLASRARHLVVATERGASRIGYVGFSRTTPAAATRVAPRPVPGAFAAAEVESDFDRIASVANGLPDLLALAAGGRASLPVVAAGPGEYRTFAVGDFSHDLEMSVEVAGRQVPLRASSSGVRSALIPLTGDQEAITLHVVRGAGALESLEVRRAVVTDDTPVTATRIPANTKLLLREDVEETVEVETRISIDRAAQSGHADLLVRASTFAMGYEGADERLGADFLLGYSIQLHADRLVLARHAYNATVLAESVHAIELAGEHSLRVRLAGGDIRVDLDGVTMMTHSDERPHLSGGVGFRTIDASIHVHSLVARRYCA